MGRWCAKATLLLLLFALALCARATPTDVVIKQAKQFLQQQALQQGLEAQITIGRTKVGFDHCDQPEPFLPHANARLIGQVTVGIACYNGNKRYLQAHIKASGDYWVAGKNLDSGTLITADMLQKRFGRLNRIPRRAVRRQDQLLGKVTTRYIAKGQVIQSSELKVPWLVHRRHTVTVEVQGRGFRITRRGTALQNGALNSVIKVRLPDRKVISGVVKGKGRVEITP